MNDTHELINTMLDFFDECMIILSKNYDVICFNQKFANLYQWDNKAATNQNIKTLALKKMSMPFNQNDLERLIKYSAPLFIKTTVNNKNVDMNWSCKKSPSCNYMIFFGKGILETGKEDGIFHELKKIAEGIPGNFYWKNTKAQYLGCNNTLLKTLGLKSVSDLVGKTDLDLWPEQAKELEKNDEQVMKHKKPIFFEETIRFSNKKPMFFTVIKMPIIDDNGNVVGNLGNSLDITELKETKNALKIAMEKAEAANKAKSEFIANMSHDIRTPLTGIIGLSSMVEDATNNETIKEYAHMLNNSGEQLLSLLNSVLEIVSAGSLQKMKVNESIVDLKVLLNNIFDLELPSLRLKSINFTLNFDDGVPTIVVTDREKLYRILLNIISNAIKFTYDGSITIQVTLVDKHEDDIKLCFKIIDTGIGIAEEDIDKVFDQFFRANPAYENKFDGYGVGLHIVQQYLERLNGDIHIDSKLGQGTCISLTIPMKTGNDASLMTKTNDISFQKENIKTQRKNEQVGTEKMLHNFQKNNQIRVLLVEDNIMASKVATNVLKKANLSYMTAKNSAEAFELFKNNEFDLVLTDIGLPDYPGTELCQKIRRFENEKKKTPLPVIALTGHGTDEIIDETAGLTDVYQKPLSPDELNHILEAFVLSNKAAGKENASQNTLQKTDENLLDVNLGVNQLGTQKMLIEMIEMMINESMPNDLPQIEQAFADKDFEQLKKKVHKFKSSCLYCATTALLEKTRSLEAIAQSRDKNKITPLYKAFQITAQKTKDYLEVWLETHKSKDG